ncbi:conserved hypothetical protein [Talaromyces stipitatus ATCC 10500]|uniref:C6 transcription factor n=1 Tax=Talaromyces stipitatus (strain ATCC 10500 / CBS 375.48 / QM 6759 / NRRL 1006) TaxID=441959 RepID=B8M1G7_TALSN|nr:uncharacterized protein TSTA_091030 [Talaromyces stipitatus ATCC 10500]EED21863.1 conserved hypothetical protein [Talaromyces stipitatus ATCC 10500]
MSFANPDASGIQESTWQHYAVVINQLLREFRDITSASQEKSLHLSVTLLVLCHVEIISGNLKGAIFSHLRACRQLILSLLQRSPPRMQSTDQELLGFALEFYAYFALMTNITPYGKNQAHTIPLDNFVTSLSPLHEYSTFGALMSCGHDLFEAIASISQLFSQRLYEQHRQQAEPSAPTMAMYEALLVYLSNWQFTGPTNKWSDPREQTWAGEIYKNALLIYLKASICGSVIDNPKVICEIQEHVDEILQLLTRLNCSPYGTIMMWPCMIAGSCLIKTTQRDFMQKALRTSRWKMCHVKQAAEILESLWRDNVKCAFGPYGLHYIMQKHGISFCMG